MSSQSALYGAVSKSDSPNGAGSTEHKGRRLARGHWVALVLGLLAFLVNMALLRDRSDTVQVAVADEEIPPATELNDNMVRYVEVAADSPLADSMLDPGVVAGGSLLTVRQIADGEPLARDAFADDLPDDGLRSMGLPIASERAAGGTLQSGDRVDVVYVDESPVYAATDVEVLSVGSADNPTEDAFLVLAVDDVEALCVAAALESGSASVVRSTGTPSAESGCDDPEQISVSSSAGGAEASDGGGDELEGPESEEDAAAGLDEDGG